jgi:hypothetical protein
MLETGERQYYHLVYGANIRKTRETNPERLWLHLEANTRIGLKKAAHRALLHQGCAVRPQRRVERTAASRNEGHSFAGRN